MSLKYIRDTYGVSAYRGQRVRYTDENGLSFDGVITSSDGSHLRIRRDGDTKPWAGRFHPIWNITYYPTQSTIEGE